MYIRDFIEENKDEYDRLLAFKGEQHLNIRILDYIKDIENGFFVECGGGNGENTSFMGKVLEDFGWNGILIEPSDSFHKWCVENRPRCINENCALVSFDHNSDSVIGLHKEQTIFEPIVGLEESKKRGVYIENIGVILEYNSNEYYDGPYKPLNPDQVINNIIIMDSVGLDPYPNKCYKASTFKDLAIKHNIKKVDVFFLDVEGYEMNVLNGIDFEGVDITYMVVEVNSLIYSLDEVDRFMGSKGYENILNISDFNIIDFPSWKGHHQDYLYKKIK